MVLARVQKVRVRQVEVVVLCVGLGGNVTGKGDELADGGETQWAVCSDDWPAVVRREDVRASEKEKVVTSEGFRVGDIVRGVVVGSFLPCYAWQISAGRLLTSLRTDQFGGPGELLSHNSEERVGGNDGEERDWEYDVSYLVEGV